MRYPTQNGSNRRFFVAPFGSPFFTLDSTTNLTFWTVLESVKKEASGFVSLAAARQLKSTQKQWGQLHIFPLDWLLRRTLLMRFSKQIFHLDCSRLEQQISLSH